MKVRHPVLVGALALALTWSGTAAQAATSWSIVPSPNRGTLSNYLSGVAGTSTSNVWAVGNWYDTGLASTRTLALRFNGTSWSSVTTPNVNNFYNELYSVDALSTSDAWAVGAYATGQSSGGNGNNGPHNTLALHWNGSAWSRVTTPQPGTPGRNLYDVDAISASDVWAVGYYQELSGGPSYESLITHWNGTAWSQVPSPNPANYLNTLSSVSGSSQNDVWAVGTYVNSGEPRGARHPLAVHWNGTAWSQVPVPTSGFAILNGVTALSPTDAWAVGTKNGYHTPVAFHWDGTAWSEVPTPPVGGATGNNFLYSVTALSTGQVWAVGYTTTTGSGPQPLAERWNGTAWTLESTPQLLPSANSDGGSLNAVTVLAGSGGSPVVWGVGYRTDLVSGGARVDHTLTLRGLGN